MRTSTVASLSMTLATLFLACASETTGGSTSSSGNSSSSGCIECGSAKPAAYALTGSNACPESVGLTRASLLDGLQGTFDSSTSMTDAGVSADAGDGGAANSVRVSFTATGDVMCQPSYNGGIVGMVQAEVRSATSIIVETSDHRFKGTVAGSVFRKSLLPQQIGAKLLDIGFEGDSDAAALGYTPATAGAKVRVQGTLLPNGRVSATFSEVKDGERPVVVATYAP